MSDSQPNRRIQRGFLVPTRALYGRPAFFVVEGERSPTSWRDGKDVEVVHEVFCEGIHIFRGPYDWREDDSGRYVYKAEFRLVANEVTSNGGSAGGSVFHRIVDFLSRRDGKNFGDIRGALSHENHDCTVAIEQGVVADMLTGTYRGWPTDKIFSGFGRLITEGVLYGLDRSTYGEERYDPTNHLGALHLGYLVIERLLERYPDISTADLASKRLDTLLKALTSHEGLTEQGWLEET